MRKSKSILLIISFLNLSVYLHSYNRENSIDYAKERWQNYNGDYNDHWYQDKDGEWHHVDCANFVSQCLIAGGFDLSQFREYLGGEGFDNKGCIVNCDVLADFLKRGVHINGVTKTKDERGGKKLEDVTTIAEGDIIIYGDADDLYKHSVIVGPGTSDNSGNFGYYAHTTDRGGDKDLNFPFTSKEFTKATVFHFPTKAEAGCNEKIFSTGMDFSGENVFISVMYSDEGNLNIEGYIWKNPDVDEQDMVIGEPEKVLLSRTGCAYLLSGYCIDAGKGAPSEGRCFSDVWTSTSPAHWAYWVRKAVEYMNNDYERTPENQMKLQDAIWCISDREGAYNEIVKGIGYDLRGPSKNVIIEDDFTPPAAVGDLRVGYMNELPILCWTTVGDDGFEGMASYYDIVYATYCFTADEFESLSRLLEGENYMYAYSYPKASGTDDYCYIIVPVEGPLFFALKALDECGNVSEMSNIASMTPVGGTSIRVKAYCWPNPVKEENPKIKVECPFVSEVKFKFYTITGEEILVAKVTSPKEVVDEVNGIYAYEYEWDVGKVASGVYWCIANVKGEVKRIKIAVVK